ncbi:hypothetical protein FOZ63_016562, partial [Perkinsus olseni]
IVEKKVVNLLMEDDAVDAEIKKLLVEKLVEEKVYSILLLGNLGNDLVLRMTAAVEEDKRDLFKLHLVSLIDEAKAHLKAKRRRAAEQEDDAADLKKLRENVAARFGEGLQIPASVIPSHKVLSRMVQSPNNYVPIGEFLSGSTDPNRGGVKHAEDLITGKTVPVQLTKSRKIDSFSVWLEGFCRWAGALFLVSPSNSEVDPLSILAYLIRIAQLVDKSSWRDAVVFDHQYRSASLGYHEQGHSLGEVLRSDMNPSLYVGAQMGKLKDDDLF